MKERPPIALFCFNRPEHTRLTVEALAQNVGAAESVLHVFSDGARTDAETSMVSRTREVVRRARGFAMVVMHEREENWGLSRNIISGITELTQASGCVIVIEDDLVTSKWFLNYMRDALEYYASEKRVYSISGFNFPARLMSMPEGYREDIYFNYRNSSWGWATWHNRWQQADWLVKDFSRIQTDRALRRRFLRQGPDVIKMLSKQMRGEINSWAIRWSFTHALMDGLSVFPVHSHVHNIGMDASGTHCGKDKWMANDLSCAKSKSSYIPVCEPNQSIMRGYRANFRRGQRIWRPLRRTIFKLRPHWCSVIGH